jgi:hypothetical protein
LSKPEETNARLAPAQLRMIGQKLGTSSRNW